MARLIVSWLLGLLFGLGLIVAQMVDPEKVRNFLDVAGAWDPSLALVLGAAVVVTFTGYRLAPRLLRRPPLGDGFHFPTNRRITPRLVLGALVFGIGWGMGGLCPGPALTSLLIGNPQLWAFVGALLAGMWLVEHGLPLLTGWQHDHILHH